MADLLTDDDRVASVVHIPGAALDPPGDVIEADVAREATSEIVADLEAAGLTAECPGVLFITRSGRTPSALSQQAEHAAPGSPDDAVVWAVVRQLDLGIAIAVLLVAGFFWVLYVVGWMPSALVTGPRPQTSFIWHPSWWAFLVALIAGAAGVLAMTVERANAMVGVFISVTTIPTMGDFALGLAIWNPPQMAGSAAQLGINLLGMLLAGTITVGIQRLAWNRIAVRSRRRRLGAARPQRP